MAVTGAVRQTTQRLGAERSPGQRAPRRTPAARPDVERLQRALGNRSIHRLLQTRAIQPKLTIGPVHDEYEREADRVADEIVRMPDRSADLSAQRVPLRLQRFCPECEQEKKQEENTATDVQRAPAMVQREDEEAQRTPIQAIQRMCPACEKETAQRTPDPVQRLCLECEEEAHRKADGSDIQRALIPLEEDIEEEEEVQQAAGGGGVIQTKRAGADPPDASAALAAYVQSSRHGGQPLPEGTRASFESRFGHDFGGVRVHIGTRAAEAASEINALAFTTGADIYFGAGRFNPGTPEGDRLLAHELTHTIQQGASPQTGLRASAYATSPEVEATPTNSSVPAVQRVCEVTPPPAGMDCPPASTSTGSGTPVLFGLDSSVLSASARSTLSAIAAAWHTGGGVAVLRVDGFASCDGAADLNWRLSCRRAQTVATELEAPSDGSPGVDNGHIEIFANGETDQFSVTSLPPNRRAVITGGGAPPPGPTCALTITGPDEVDHYCAAYVPSDAAACGVFPAPNITLTVTGAAAGATLRWSIARGAARASIVGANTGASVNIQGDAASGAQGDVTVHVTDGTCTTPHFLTVREPSALTAAPAAANTPTVVQTNVTYTVRDQFGNPMGANICIDETITVCRVTHPRGIAFGDAPTDAAGQAVDRLRLGPLAGVPAGFCRLLNQSLTAGGCGPLLNNTIVFQTSGITLNLGASCVVGDPCP
jgi:outer membrane protein OmpA-like peptidoglycan-associated protein